MDFEDYVKRVPPNKTLVNWWDLYPKSRAELYMSFKEMLMKMALAKAGNKYTYLARETGVNRRAISKYLKNNRAMPLSNLRKLIEYANMPLEEANNKITRIGKLKPRFPFDLHSWKGAEIRAAFLSDGHIDKNPVKVCRYHACEKELHLRLVGLCKSVFGEFETETKPDSNTYKTYFPSVVGSALFLGGVPRGDKIKANPFLPKDILLGSKKIQCAYLRRVFDDEGDVCFEKKSKRAVRLTRSYAPQLNLKIEKGRWMPFKGLKPSNLILGEYLLLKKIIGGNVGLYPEGVYKSTDNQISAKHRIQLTQRDNLEKFYKEIGFSVKAKKSKLKKAINSYQIRKSQNGEGLKFILKKIEKVCHERGGVRYRDVSAEFMSIGRTRDLAGTYLKKLVDMKILIKIRRGGYVLAKDYNNKWFAWRASLENRSRASIINL